MPPLFQAGSLNAPALDALNQLNAAVAFGISALSRVPEEAFTGWWPPPTDAATRP